MIWFDAMAILVAVTGAGCVLSGVRRARSQSVSTRRNAGARLVAETESWLQRF